MLLLHWRLRTTGQRAAAGEGAGEGVDEGVYEAGEQKEAHRRGAPLAGTAKLLTCRDAFGQSGYLVWSRLTN